MGSQYLADEAGRSSTPLITDTFLAALGGRLIRSRVSRQRSLTVRWSQTAGFSLPNSRELIRISRR